MTEQPRIQKSVWGCLIGFGLLLLAYFALGPFDNTTQLTPRHGSLEGACFATALITGLVSAVVAILKSKNLSLGQRCNLTFAMTMLGFLSVLLAGSRSTSIIAGWIDFPPGKTATYDTQIEISRAYQTSGKNKSCNIQTTPIWSDLEITESDYAFMLNHRPAGDTSGNPDEISSHGYFCARVTVQQFGDRLRVMNAGSKQLPRGTVVLCPPSSGL